MQHHQGSKVVLSTTLLNGIRLVDRKALKQPAELPFREVTNFGCVAWPLKPEVIIRSFLKTLVQQTETVLLVMEYLDAIGTSSAEEEDRVAVRIQLIGVTYDRHQTINAFSHVGIARNQVDVVCTGDVA